tara:strand:+ start:310 stop:627 length:318 start_codon:yes stop_codon:yes gene_type:complete
MIKLIPLLFLLGGCGGLGEGLIANALGGLMGGLATNHMQDKIDEYKVEKALEADALFEKQMEEEMGEDWEEEIEEEDTEELNEDTEYKKNNRDGEFYYWQRLLLN